ncbi:hypothetical protein GPJ56_006802 [Histomonas meleagridis]|uniref:uncharacterized protein n=1 Tax=Histomonas meleagridis TaxID=135588 RepID=UPI00355A9D19|nr:hypothetical protein GPJ56_006802 [Histomonas meleagridis]KAH0800211.1 hypothetical protein GO595_007323 [Histomonas meleagridis]
MTEGFNFLLPTICNENLVDPDTSQYSLVVYDRKIISEATRVIMKSFESMQDEAYISTEKRLDTIMEFYAVALTLEETDYVDIGHASSVYRKWLEDSSLFGSAERQNQYMIRIIKQLSSPFNLTTTPNIKNEGPVHQILSDIIDSYRKLFTERGTMLETNTWRTLVFVLIGICHHLITVSSSFSKKGLEELKSQAIKCCFLSIQVSPFTQNYDKFKDVFEVFLTHSKIWSDDLIFIQCWSQEISTLFRYTSERLYKLPFTDNLFQTGIYSTGGETISDRSVSILFYNTLRSLEFRRSFADPESAEELYKAIDKVTDIAIEVSKIKSNSFLLKFSGKAFMELFGKILTFAPMQDKRFDKAASIRAITIIKLLTNFDKSGTEETFKKLISSLSLFFDDTTQHTEVVESFLSNGISLYGSDRRFLQLISRMVIQSLPLIEINNNRSQEKNYSIVSMFVSSIETQISLSNVTNYTFNDTNLFDKLYKNLQNINIQPLLYILMCRGINYQLPIISKMSEYFSLQTFQSLVEQEISSAFITGCIDFIGTSIRFIPEISYEIKKTKIFKQILNCILNCRILDVYDPLKLIYSCLQMILNILDNDSTLFNEPGTIPMIFKFISFVNKNVSEKKRQRNPSSSKTRQHSSIQLSSPLFTSKSPSSNDFSKLQSCESSPRSSRKNSASSSKLNSQIHSLISLLLARLNLHLPFNDRYTHKFNSSNEINEQFIIKQFNINNPEIHYFTVGRSLLISFIEQKDKDETYILSRGQFGKSAWILTEDTMGTLEEPKLSDEIKPTDLDMPSKLEKVDLVCFGENKENINEMTNEELENADNKCKELYAKEYSKWINWNDNKNFFIPFNYKPERNRSRVVDFISRIGLFESNNKFDIRPQNNLENIEISIREFEKYEKPYLFPIEVIHVLPIDKSYHYTEAHQKRMTPLMLRFLKEIGEPFSIKKEDSELMNWPKLRSSIPSFPILGGFGVFISPALCDDSETFEKIKNLHAPIKVLFNETEFILNKELIEKEFLNGSDSDHLNLILIVKPTLNGLYHVTQVKGINYPVSPFWEQQTMTPKTLLFSLALTMELIDYKQMLSSKLKERRNALSLLCQENSQPELGMISPNKF